MTARDRFLAALAKARRKKAKRAAATKPAVRVFRVYADGDLDRRPYWRAYYRTNRAS